MQVKIANKEYTLYFGWEFLDQINNKFGLKVEAEGQDINTRSAGLPFMQSGLSSYDPIALVKVIQAGTATEPQKPSLINVRQFVEELLINKPKEYKEFVDELSNEIKKEPMLKAMDKLNK